MWKVIPVAMETDRLCLSSTIQDVLHEQGHSEDCCIGLQSAAITQSAQTQLQKNTTVLSVYGPCLSPFFKKYYFLYKIRSMRCSSFLYFNFQ